MLNENQIRSLPLEDQQKFVIELKTVAAGDKYYETAQRLIKFTEQLKGYKAPELIEVKNIAGHDISVDGKSIANEATAKVFPWQFAALRRYLEKAAALLIFTLCLCASVVQVSAQIQPYIIGSPTTYNVQAVNGFAGWTNYLCTGTNAAGLGCIGYSNVLTTTNLFLTAAVTNTTTIITNANWSLVNGIPTNAVTYTTNVVINYPGVVSCVNYDMVDLFIGAQWMTAGTGTNLLVQWDFSPDMVNWRTNALTQTLVLNGTAYQGTNTSLTLFAPGYLRVNNIYESGNLFQPVTNITVEVTKKPYRTGP